MTWKLVTRLALAALLLGVPAGSKIVTAADMQFLRVACLAPRDSELAKSFLRVDKGLRAASHDTWGIRLYAGGTAGDEVDVLRKMKVGQMDASIITTTGLSHIVREVALLDSPGVINNYKQFEAVTSAMRGEWEQSFDKAGFKLVAWSEGGQYRWFSKTPITRVTDLKNVRPWVWPASYILKEIYHNVGANGVPLGVPEVYGALQTGMVDTVITTAAALVALQWHSNLKFATKAGFGILVNAMVVSADKWKAIPPDVAGQVLSETRKVTEGEREAWRKADLVAYQNLLKRGYTATEWAPGGEQEYRKMEQAVRDVLVGRLYPAALLKRVMAIAVAADSGTASAAPAK
jgi:TRAP-type C4-dicarboxylate transport system substrate-binding protein